MARLCPQCGVVAPQHVQRCALCEHALGDDALAPPEPPPGMAWASTWCRARCPACRAEATVDRLDADRVTCPACGEPFGIRAMRRAMDYAHAVADLAGPDPEGRFPDPAVSVAADNPFKAFGLLQSVSEDRRDEVVVEEGVRRASVSVRVAPGHPLCETCRAPLGVTVEGDGAVTARCPRCAAASRLEVVAQAAASLGSVRGVLASGGRAWVLFEGPSRMREELARAARKRAGLASRTGPRAAAVARPDAPPPPPPAAQKGESPPPEPPRPPPEGGLRDDAPRAPATRGALVVLGVVLAVLAALLLALALR